MTLVSERPPLTAPKMRQLTAPTARYQTKSDPEGILRRGLVEEVAEYVMELDPDKPVDVYAVEGEIGDVVWYGSEISRYRREPIAGMRRFRTLDELQQRAKPEDILPIFDPEGNRLDIADKPQVALAVAALRVVDIMNPKNSGLWLRHDRPASLPKALGDLLKVAGIITSQHSISLSDALYHTLDKLNSRERQPHVIDEATAEVQITSLRHRLGMEKYVYRLLAITGAAEVDELLSLKKQQA